MSNNHVALRDCRLCARLVEHHAQVACKYPAYHAAPVGSWGSSRPQILIVGLAPGLHGAARTGKAFVGDASGHFLFAALHRHGLATSSDPEEAKLIQARITNAVKCLPPGNAPIASEINACRPYLQQEIERYTPANARRPRVLVTLGGVAHKAVCRALGCGNLPFEHGAIYQLGAHTHLISSFHPSRLNVNTGRLTQDMFDQVLSQAKTLAVL